METLNEKLECVTQQAIKKRLKREFEDLIKLDICNGDNISIELCDNVQYYNTNYKVGFYNIKDSRYYEFIISLNYPFHSPKLNINFKPYSHYHKIESMVFKESLYKRKGIRCFCCETVLCGNNWSPAMSIKTVLNEVIKFHNFCKEITDIVIIKVIKRKFLIEDINLIEWLY